MQSAGPGRTEAGAYTATQTYVFFDYRFLPADIINGVCRAALMTYTAIGTGLRLNLGNKG